MVVCAVVERAGTHDDPRSGLPSLARGGAGVAGRHHRPLRLWSEGVARTGATKGQRLRGAHRASQGDGGAVCSMTRNRHARPWPEGQPRQEGERCELSDLLIDQCACRVHKEQEVVNSGPAEEQEFDFRHC